VVTRTGKTKEIVRLFANSSKVFLRNLRCTGVTEKKPELYPRRGFLQLYASRRNGDLS